MLHFTLAIYGHLLSSLLQSAGHSFSCIKLLYKLGQSSIRFPSQKCDSIKGSPALWWLIETVTFSCTFNTQSQVIVLGQPAITGVNCRAYTQPSCESRPLRCEVFLSWHNSLTFTNAKLCVLRREKTCDSGQSCRTDWKTIFAPRREGFRTGIQGELHPSQDAFGTNLL